LIKDAPSAAFYMAFGAAGPVLAQCDIARQMFLYTTFSADMVKPCLPVMTKDGAPKRRTAFLPLADKTTGIPFRGRG
jgi:glycerol transport system substrate-binding protein